MNIMHGIKDIFEIPRKTYGTTAVCITTNGMTKKDGTAVMGAGIAKSADIKFHLAFKLGNYLRKYGNRCFYMGEYSRNDPKYAGASISLITFPTKHNWRDDSDLALIEESCVNLVKIANARCITDILLPPPGCKNGHLDWESQVKPILEKYLDDRFTVCLPY